MSSPAAQGLLTPKSAAILVVGAIVGLIGFPVLAAAVLEDSGAWVIGLLVGLVFVLQVALVVLLRAALRRVDRVNSRVVSAIAQQSGVLEQRLEGLGTQAAQRSEQQSRHITHTVNSTTTAQVAAVRRQLEQSTAKLIQRVIDEHVGGVRQTHALMQLFTTLRIERPLPGLGGFAATPELLLYLVDLLRTRRPAVVVELGSGSSTLFMAMAVQQFQLPTRVISIDHDEHYGELTRASLVDAGVGGFAEVRIAPLADAGVQDHEPPWYDIAAFEGIDAIDILIVDGPPGYLGAQSRYPAFPRLRERLAPGALVLIDDFDRPDEKAMGERWAEAAPGSFVETLPVLKGLGVLHLP